MKSRMISKQSVFAFVAFAGVVAIFTTSVAQERQKKLGAADYPTLSKAAEKAFSEKKYVTCAKQLKQLLALCGEGVQKELVARRPAAPDKFEAVPVKAVAKTGAFGSGLAAVVGHTAEYSYRETGGQGSVKVVIHADSTIAHVLDAQFKFAGMNPNLEEVKYGEHKALLESKNDGKLLILKILIAGAHYIEITARGITDGTLFEMFNQAFVDNVAAVLG